jgi:hypothetical protein
LPGGYWKALDKAADIGGTKKGIFFNRKKSTTHVKEAFTNPAGPGRKTFSAKHEDATNAISSRSNGRGRKDAMKRTLLLMIEFTPQPAEPVRSSEYASHRTKQKSQSQNH